MRFLFVALALSIIAAPSGALASPRAFDQGPVHVILADAPKRLEFQVDVPAARAEVWNAFATAEGMRTWLGPKVSVDLRVGGDWLVYFPGGLTGGGTILMLQAPSMIAFGALAPPSMPSVRRDRTFVVYTFDEVSPSVTRVRMAVAGFKDGAEWNDAYDHLAGGDAEYLAALYDRFAKGPTDWSKMH